MIFHRENAIMRSHPAMRNEAGIIGEDARGAGSLWAEGALSRRNISPAAAPFMIADKMTNISAEYQAIIALPIGAYIISHRRD